MRKDLTVVDASAWIFKGTGLHNGSVLPAAIGSDVDSLQPRASHPANVQVLAHSGLPVNQAQANTRDGNTFYSDMTYYADPTSKAGVWTAAPTTGYRRCCPAAANRRRPRRWCSRSPATCSG